jgi:hypothetical protein
LRNKNRKTVSARIEKMPEPQNLPLEKYEAEILARFTTEEYSGGGIILDFDAYDEFRSQLYDEKLIAEGAEKIRAFLNKNNG